jgi:SAM-dependent methyltransferase
MPGGRRDRRIRVLKRWVVPADRHSRRSRRLTSELASLFHVQTFLTLPYEKPLALPPPWDGHDPRTPPAFVRHFLTEYTDSGDTVFDPFAGFGTTLTVAEELDRVGVGVEFERERVEFVRDRLSGDGDSDTDSRIRQGDVLSLDATDLPAADCCLTSPPFATRGIDRNPFENYASEGDYDDYLTDLGTAFGNVADCLRPGGSLLVDVSNLKSDAEVTTLAWDVADVLRDDPRLDFRGEVVVGWDAVESATAQNAASPEREGAFGYGYDHSYCLVFERPE